MSCTAIPVLENRWGINLGIPVYLDNQATTPLDPIVLEAMLPFFKENYGNAASVHHSIGRDAKEAVERSRKLLAQALNARSREIIITSGATESINLAIRGICEKNRDIGKHIITQNTEHKAVLDTYEIMANDGWDITIVPVDADGNVDPESVRKAMRQDTILVSIMHANNEIGTIQPIAEIGAICKDKNVRFLVDACQSFGKLTIDVNKMNIDLLAATAHKIYGPKGIGLLYVRRNNPKVELITQMTGGGHEFSYRSGTLPVPLVVGFAKAIEKCLEKMENENAWLKTLRDKMIDEIFTSHPDTILNGSRENRLSNNINFCFPNIDAETLIIKMKGIACSTGSACSSANLEPSHVLKAIGLKNEMAHSSIRFSLGRFNTKEEIRRAIDEINHVLSSVKENSPRQQLLHV